MCDVTLMNRCQQPDIYLFAQLQVYDAFINICICIQYIWYWCMVSTIIFYINTTNNGLHSKPTDNPMNEWLNERMNEWMIVWMNEFNWIYIEKSLWYERQMLKEKRTKKQPQSNTKTLPATIPSLPRLIRKCALCVHTKWMAGIICLKNAMHFIYLHSIEWTYTHICSIPFHSILLFYAFSYTYINWKTLSES